MAEGLTTTSYAILGLLGVRPWTTYELAQQMKRAVGQFWPRAESNLYAEPKKLVALGLATASQEKVGNRPRTLYTITPEGRQALAEWIPDAGGGAGARVRAAAQGLLRRARVQGRPPGRHRGRPDVDRGAAWRPPSSSPRVPAGPGPVPRATAVDPPLRAVPEGVHPRRRPVGGVGGGGGRDVAGRHPRRDSPTGPPWRRWPPTPRTTSGGRPSVAGAAGDATPDAG